MKKHIYTLGGILLVLSVTLSGCMTAKKYYEAGNYDAAVQVGADKLRKNPKKKDKHIIYMEKAYNTAMQQELDRIEYLRLEGNPDCWVEIFDLYNGIKYKQDAVRPLLPLFIESEFRYADFRMIEVNDEIINAKAKAAEYLYANAMKLMESGDKFDAREAYGELLKIGDYYSDFKDVDEQLNRAHQMGMNFVLVEMRNNSFNVVPSEFENEFNRMSTADLNSLWVDYHTRPVDDLEYDYRVIVNVENIDVGPEQIREKEFVDQMEVEDGFDYVLDKNGNVMKDTLGNDIKVAKYKTVTSVVSETHQSKAGNISGSFDYFDDRTQQLVKTVPFSETMIFENQYAVSSGDKRALSKENKAKLGGNPAPFPSDYFLIMDGANIVRDKLMYDLRCNIGLTMN